MFNFNSYMTVIHNTTGTKLAWTVRVCSLGLHMVRDWMMKIHKSCLLPCQIVSEIQTQSFYEALCRHTVSLHTHISLRHESRAGNIILKRLRKKRPGHHLLWSDAVQQGSIHSFTTQSKSHAGAFKHTICELVIIRVCPLASQAQFYHGMRVNAFLCVCLESD